MDLARSLPIQRESLLEQLTTQTLSPTETIAGFSLLSTRAVQNQKPVKGQKCLHGRGMVTVIKQRSSKEECIVLEGTKVVEVKEEELTPVYSEGVLEYEIPGERVKHVLESD